MTEIHVARPPIVLCLSDHEALEKAAFSALLHAPREAGALLEEVDRADVVADADLRADAVRLGSRLVFEDGLTGAVRRVRLVSSLAEDATGQDLSVLTSEGTALIGLREGQTVVWSDRLGARRVLTVLKLERAADST